MNKYIHCAEISSPEKLYAYLQYAKEEGLKHTSIKNIYMYLRKRNISIDDLMEKYPYPERYKRIGEKPVKGEPYDNDDWAR